MIKMVARGHCKGKGPIVIESPTLIVKSDFQVGWDLYAAGAADSDCQTPEQVRGWWHALDADCTADMCSVLADDGVDSFEMDEIFNQMNRY